MRGFCSAYPVRWREKGRSDMHGLSGIWFLLLTGLGAPAWGESSDFSNSSSAFTLAEDDLERLAEKLSSRSAGQHCTSSRIPDRVCQGDWIPHVA